MKVSITGQEKGDCLIDLRHKMVICAVYSVLVKIYLSSEI